MDSDGPRVSATPTYGVRLIIEYEIRTWISLANRIR